MYKTKINKKSQMNSNIDEILLPISKYNRVIFKLIHLISYQLKRKLRSACDSFLTDENLDLIKKIEVEETKKNKKNQNKFIYNF